MTANPNDATSYDDCGFDISHWNGPDLDFAQLAGPGGRKVCELKVTEDTGGVDDRFVAYADAAGAAGITRLAAYHFAHHGEVQAQMDHFVKTFVEQRAKVTRCPPCLFMLDLERGANPPNETDGLAMVAYLKNLGIAPLIYCGYDFWSQAYPQLADCGCFLAAYNSHPTSPLPWRIPSADVYGWDLWQYTGDSLGPYAKDIPGGSHGMDLSCFNLKKRPEGVEAWWDAMLAKTRQP
jgi:GH25 family lysozyme M1 (1,4-beta-N-acetylmuramidase)